MSRLSSYLSKPSLLIGFRAIHSSLGSGVVTGIAEKDGNDYVFVKFDHDGSTVDFEADIFLGKWSEYFTHSLDGVFNLDGKMRSSDRELRSLFSSLRDSSTNPYRSSLPTLGTKDYRLCLAWSGHPLPEIPNPDVKNLEELLGTFETGRLMSARVAELAAIDYFRALGHQVQDVSISQVDDGNNSQWKDFDLLVDGRPVDVKNARKSFSGREGYVEHCVPRFKQDRQTNIDVSILGVLSDFQRPGQIALGIGVCLILGEVNINDIRHLYAWVRNRFGNLIDFKGLWAPDYQPGWVFEYSPEFYRERIAAIDQIKDAIEQLKESGIRAEHVPGWLLALCKDKSVIVQPSLPQAMQSILNDLHDLRDKVGLTRPALFVYVMAHFLEAITRFKNWQEVIAPLRNIIFEPDAKTLSHPLGLSDPKKYVGSLINIFEQVFDETQRQGIRFTGFKLQHPSILKGMSADGVWITLLAYCGGWLMAPVKVKCGATPLHLGCHATCQHCGHLICDQCGFCSIGCDLVAKRQERIAQKASAQPI